MVFQGSYMPNILVVGTASTLPSIPASSSIFRMPRARQGTTTPGCSGYGVITSTSTGSPSPDRVLGHIAVVGRVVHGRGHETVHEDGARFLVHFVLDGVGFMGISMTTLKVSGRFLPGVTLLRDMLSFA
jgi:hypothetical protein